MRWLVLLGFACLLGCADYRQKPTFPVEAAHQPVLDEQAILGLSRSGDALVAHLLDADGEPPQLRLLVFDARGAPTRVVLEAQPELARAVSARLLQQGTTPIPLLEDAVRGEWGQALTKAQALGFRQESPAMPGPGGFASPGSSGEPLMLREVEARGPPHALALCLSEAGGGPEVELSRMPMSGEPVAPQLFLNSGVAWMLSGSFRRGAPLHRTVGVRRGGLRRGEAELHTRIGLAEWSAGNLAAARVRFGKAIAADDGYADALYQAARAAAIGFLRRAAAADPARVQVLGRGDAELRRLRARKDVQDLLGERRPAPENVPPPP
jgi:hypothetical protein